MVCCLCGVTQKLIYLSIYSEDTSMYGRRQFVGNGVVSISSMNSAESFRYEGSFCIIK